MATRIKKVDRSITWGAKDPKTNKILPSYDNCKDYWVPGLNKETGILNTGLTIKDRKYFEEQLEYEEGTLSASSSYWSTFKIEIPREGLILRDGNIKDELKKKVLLADNNIAKSLIDLKTKAKANYVITSDSAEAKTSNIVRNNKAKAYATFYKLSQSEIVDALFLYGKDPSSLDSEIAQDRLGDMLEKNPNKFITIVGDKLFKDKVYFMKLIKEGVVTKHGTGIGTNMPLYFEDIMLGTGLEESIAFIKSKENQKIALGIKAAYENR